MYWKCLCLKTGGVTWVLECLLLPAGSGLSSPLGSWGRHWQGPTSFAGVGASIPGRRWVICSCCHLLYFVCLDIGRSYPKSQRLAVLLVLPISEYLFRSLAALHSLFPFSSELLEHFTSACRSLIIIHGGVGYLSIHLFKHILMAYCGTDTMSGSHLC